MTISEASRKYQIPAEILREYEALVLCGTQKNSAADWECDDHDLEVLNLLILLHASGFNWEEIKSYLGTPPKTKKALAKWLRALNQKRAKTLDEIHSKEAQLDSLDYLRYELKKRETEL